MKKVTSFNFVGRKHELKQLQAELDVVREKIGTTEPGRCLLIRGRRRVGKSLLAEVFIQHAGVPSAFYTASGVSADVDLAQFQEDIAASSLIKRHIYTAATPDSWLKSLQLLAEILPEDRPSIVVIDEVPYLVKQNIGFEGALQRCWDRSLSRKPLLLLLIGSDLSMMEAFNSYGRPFHQRGREMVINPLNPADVGSMLKLDAGSAFDAHLITGGLPLICREWKPGDTLWTYLKQALASPTSALRVTGALNLAAEFPESTHAHRVLRAIGSGERTFTNIANAAGHIAPGGLNRSLELLTEKRVVAGELPLSTKLSKQRRYYVDDPYLRFWLRFIEPHVAELERMRSDITMQRIEKAWTSWRGRAIEPTIREALARILPDKHLPATEKVGGYWTRTNDVEIDIVGADRAPAANAITFVGSVKWLEHSTFDRHDLAELIAHRAQLPGASTETPLVAITREKSTLPGIDAHYNARDLIKGWQALSTTH